MDLAAVQARQAAAELPAQEGDGTREMGPWALSAGRHRLVSRSVSLSRNRGRPTTQFLRTTSAA